MKDFNKIRHLSAGSTKRVFRQNDNIKFVSGPKCNSFYYLETSTCIYALQLHKEFGLSFRKPWTFEDVIDYMFDLDW